MQRSLLALAALISAETQAQFSAPHMVEYTELSIMEVSHVMRINGDAANDVVVCSVDKGIGFILNDGSGNFGEIQWIDLDGFDGSQVYFASGDVDNDGDEDLLAAMNGTWVRYYANTGQGMLSAGSTVVASIASLKFLRVADLDGDGTLDMLLNDQWDGQVLWYHGLGDGQYDQTVHLLSTTASVWAGWVEDLDADGDIDVVTATADGLYAWAANDGIGTFGSWQTIASTTSGADVRTADLDGDGDPDVLGGSGGNTSCWWANNGSGQFGAQQDIATGLYGLEANLVADMDDDGDLDVLPSAYHHQWYANDGSGQFTLAQVITTAELGSCAVADVDADGDVDLMELQRQLSWYPNDGSGGIGTRVMIITNVDQIFTMRVADLDGDGDEDLVADTHGFGPRVMFYLNNGDGTFGVARMACDTVNSQDMRVADIDNDGDVDIAIMGYGSTIWLANDGTANFSFAQSFATPAYPRQLVLEDLDGDGDRDMAYSDLGDQVLMRLNNGSGVFGVEQLIDNTFPVPEGLVACDVDSDGDLDLISCSQDTYDVVWFENDGSATFSAPQVIWNNLSTFEVGTERCADINGDGATDLVYMSDQWDIVWSENTGGGTFAPGVYIGTPFGDYTDVIAPVDADQDGDLDIIIASYEPDIIYWHRNDGNGNFSPPEIIDPLITGTGRDIYARDMDLDGGVDIVVGLGNGAGGERVQWYESFIGSPYHIDGLLFHDIDEDGMQDAGEGPLPFVAVGCDPIASMPLSNTDGSYSIYTDPGTYDVSVDLPNAWWGLTTTPAVYSPTLTAVAPVSTGNIFGYAPIVDTTLIELGVAANLGLCGDTMMIHLIATNVGTSLPSGTFCGLLDTLFTVIGFDPPPTSVTGNMYCWDIDSLYYYTPFVIAAEVVVPDASYIGSIITGGIQLTETDALGNVLQTWQQGWAAPLNCSYDPNHKEVDPVGYGEAGAVDIDTDKLEYTIHFQNTGTAPAQDVVLVDRLGNEIDASTIQVLGYSHVPSLVQVEADRDLVVRFDGIQLPDSGSTFTGSQGYFRFRAQLVEGLAHGTVIENTADIYFDNNPAVVTNTTTTTLVDCSLWSVADITMPVWNLLMAPEGDAYQWFLDGLAVTDATQQELVFDANGEYTVEVTSGFGCVGVSEPYTILTATVPDVADNGPVVMPNPFGDRTEVIFKETLTNENILLLVDVNGRLVRTFKAAGLRKVVVDREGLTSGVYTLLVTYPQGRIGSARLVVQQ